MRKELPKIAAKTKTILIIDDNERLCRALSMNLSSENFDVLLEYTGNGGINTFAKNSQAIDLVILDYTLTDMKGTQVLQSLINIREDIPVIISSGLSIEEYKDQMSITDHIDFLQKPYKKNQMVEKIMSLLED